MTDSACDIWPRFVNKDGYGLRRVSPTRTQLAHRAAWESANGPIPLGLTIDHLCRTRACVNVEHMEVVTLRENILRGEGFAARQARQTHCLRGHSLADAQVYGRRRHCRQCQALYRQKRRAAQ